MANRLLVPSVSTGNVPQLALDLLIYTYGFKLVKSLDDEHLYPFAGPLDGTALPVARGLTTACQLFQLDDISLIQLRSPPIYGHKNKFIESLKEHINGEVLVVGSANAGMRLQNLDQPRITEYTKETVPEVLPESGFMIDAVKTLDARALVLFTYEGDNIGNAREMATLLAETLGLPAKSLVAPISWQRVYGKDIPIGVEQGLYT